MRRYAPEDLVVGTRYEISLSLDEASVACTAVFDGFDNSYDRKPVTKWKNVQDFSFYYYDKDIYPVYDCERTMTAEEP